MSLSQRVDIEAEGSGRRLDRRRTLFGACLAHLVHDGYTDMIYVLLPVWQRQFGLDYAALALLRCLYSGTMGGLQVPGDRWTRRIGGRYALVGATLVAAGGYLVVSLPGGLVPLCAGLVLGGLGSSVQHPRASLLVSEAFADGARRPLSVYNFAGDLGKSAFPPAVALLLLVVPWRGATALLGLVGVLGAAALSAVLPRRPVAGTASSSHRTASGTRAGFRLLLLVGILDTTTRMGFLLFLPFLLRAKGGEETAIGFGFAVLFGGGAFGKAVCGWLGDRLGVVPTVIGTESATALLIIAVLLLPLGPALVALPFLGVVLNGTSSVLYGTVPELAPTPDVGRAFALFYTGTIGSGALAPVLFGVIGDHAGRTPGVVAAATAALATIPAVLAMRRHAGAPTAGTPRAEPSAL